MSSYYSEGFYYLEPFCIFAHMSSVAKVTAPFCLDSGLNNCICWVGRRKSRQCLLGRRTVPRVSLVCEGCDHCPSSTTAQHQAGQLRFTLSLSLPLSPFLWQCLCPFWPQASVLLWSLLCLSLVSGVLARIVGLSNIRLCDILSINQCVSTIDNAFL